MITDEKIEEELKEIEGRLKSLKNRHGENEKEKEDRLKDLEKKLNFLNDSKETNIGKISLEYGRVEPQTIIIEEYYEHDFLYY
ncbi:MAG: hypothetical protein LBT66_09020 [Methanobrevibacter sp.]|nr:hypothetical protein [Candidatus Methanovirga meridionalis]